MPFQGQCYMPLKWHDRGTSKTVWALITLFMGLYGNVRVNPLHVTKKIGLDIIE